MATLHLPEELLAMVVGFLELPSSHDIAQGDSLLVRQNLSTLAALCRTSKALFRITKPILYKVYPGVDIADPQAFADALLKDPSKGRLVRDIVLSPWNEWRSNWGEGHRENSRWCYCSTCQEVDSYQPAASRRALLAARQSQVKVVGRLNHLLRQCPQVQTIDISSNTLDHGSCQKVLADLLSVSTLSLDSGRSFDRLRSLALRNTDERKVDPDVICSISPLLARSGIEALSLQGIAIVEMFGEGFEQVQVEWPSLTRLRLFDCPLCPDSFQQLLENCTGLQTLEIISKTGEDFVDLDADGEVLCKYGTRLKHFVFDSGDCSADWTPMYGEMGLALDEAFGIKTLRGMTSLRSLVAHAWVLFGIKNEVTAQELLPHSLESLTLLPTPVESMRPCPLRPCLLSDIGALLASEDFSALRTLRCTPSSAILGLDAAATYPGWLQVTDFDPKAAETWHTFTRQAPAN